MLKKGAHKVSQRYEVKQLRAVEKIEEDIYAEICKLYGVDDISETPLDLDLYKIWDRAASEREIAMVSEATLSDVHSSKF
jgi:hypothetical protein